MPRLPRRSSRLYRAQRLSRVADTPWRWLARHHNLDFKTASPHISSVLIAPSLIFVFLIASLFGAQAGEITATLKSPSMVYRLDSATGAFKGSIQVTKAVSVGCDGKTIAVLLANGFVNRYDAESGAYKGAFQVGDDPHSVQVSGGVIAVRTKKQLIRYKASNGSYLGSSQI